MEQLFPNSDSATQLRKKCEQTASLVQAFRLVRFHVETPFQFSIHA